VTDSPKKGRSRFFPGGWIRSGRRWPAGLQASVVNGGIDTERCARERERAHVSQCGAPAQHTGTLSPLLDIFALRHTPTHMLTSSKAFPTASANSDDMTHTHISTPCLTHSHTQQTLCCFPMRHWHTHTPARKKNHVVVVFAVQVSHGGGRDALCLVQVDEAAGHRAAQDPVRRRVLQGDAPQSVGHAARLPPAAHVDARADRGRVRRGVRRARGDGDARAFGRMHAAPRADAVLCGDADGRRLRGPPCGRERAVGRSRRRARR
jgi:hypothetical protein